MNRMDSQIFRYPGFFAITITGSCAGYMDIRICFFLPNPALEFDPQRLHQVGVFPTMTIKTFV